MPKKPAPSGAPPLRVEAPKCIDMKAIAARSDVSYATLRTWRRRGVFTVAPFQPPGTRKVLFPVAEVDAWWSAQRRPA